MSKYGLTLEQSRSDSCIGELLLCYCFLYVIAHAENQTVYCFVGIAAFFEADL